MLVCMMKENMVLNSKNIYYTVRVKCNEYFSAEILISNYRNPAVNLTEVCGNYLRGKWLHTKVFSEIVSKHIRLLKYEDRSRKQKR